MLKHAPKAILVSLILLLSTPLIVIAAPTEENLVQAWETAVKSDPNTKEFKKISNNLYQFKTSKIPFDGKVQIEVFIAESYYTTGNIEAQFVDVTEEFKQKNARRLSFWQSNNSQFVFIKEKDKWISSIEFAKNYVEHSESFEKQQPNKGEKPLIWNLFINLLMPLLILMVFTIIISKTTKNQNKKEVERVISIHEDNNRLLKEILSALKERNNQEQ